MVVLSAIFTMALNDQVTSLHPCKGVKTPPVPAQPRTIITPEQFAVLYECLPDELSKLLVETAVNSGLRWGELTELRVRDLDFSTRILTVSRAVVQVDPKFHPLGSRFGCRVAIGDFCSSHGLPLRDADPNGSRPPTVGRVGDQRQVDANPCRTPEL